MKCSNEVEAQEKDSTLDFTNRAWETMHRTVENSYFREHDAALIYRSLEEQMRLISFGDYLKRYIYRKAGLTGPYDEIPLKEYQVIIRDSFADHDTPPSFTPTTARLSTLSKCWLTQQSVRRKVVFLLGFGLGMSAEDVNLFLTKALQEHAINPKSPFEVICWFCYQNNYSYLRFQKLWEQYRADEVHCDLSRMEDEYTFRARNRMLSVTNEGELFFCLSQLKHPADDMIQLSTTTQEVFRYLYDESKKLVANLYNTRETNGQKRNFARLCTSKEFLRPEDVTASDLEQVLCAAIPKNEHRNLVPSRRSKLNQQFAGKRFSRQHISELLAGELEVDRFDLMTLNFFLHSQKPGEPDRKKRYMTFLESMNSIFARCSMGEVYIQNPYECFVLMCLLSDDPLCTYADVWELAYQE